LFCWTLGNVDLVPTTPFFIIINVIVVFVVAVVISSSILDIGRPDSFSDFAEQ